MMLIELDLIKYKYFTPFFLYMNNLNKYSLRIFRYYINYKMMKKRVQQYAQQMEAGAIEHRHVLKDFSRMLDIRVSQIVMSRMVWRVF